MAKIFLTDIDLNGNKLKNILLDSVSNVESIANPKAGLLVFDEADSRFKYYNGSAWIAGAEFNFTSLAEDVANKRYAIVSGTTQGEGENAGTTTVSFRAIAVSDEEALTIAMSDGVIVLGLKLDGKTLVQSAAGLKSGLTLKKLATPNGDAAASWELQDAEGNKVGDALDLDKDRHLKTTQFGYENDTFDVETGEITPVAEGDETGDPVLHLVFFTTDEDGKFGYKLENLNFQKYLEEAEFDSQKGLEVVKHVVRIKIASDSEVLGETAVLSFGTDGGIKISGIKEAIDKAVLAGSSSVVLKEGEKFIQIIPTTDEATGKTTYTINTTDVASAALLGTIDDDAEQATAFGFIAKLRAEVEAYTVNGKKVSESPTLDATDIKVTDDYEMPEEVADVEAGDSIEVAIGKIEAKINANAHKNHLAEYKHVIASATTSPVTITAATHKCGKFPTVVTYLGGEKVETGVSINADGDVVISWNGALTADMTVVVIGNPELA